jgi:tRNA 2-selenouridine synthase
MTLFASRVAAVGQIAEFTDILDVRSPLEYAVDHVPGAVNTAVLDDGQRAIIGTMHRQVSAFDARRVGAAMVARNIARIVETIAAGKPRDWAPLVYCWRGGQRSRSLTLVLAEIGFRAKQLNGGYRAYRQHVAAGLLELPARFHYTVICGLTGSGKSRLLEALAAADAQVLDLERLANHRGSLLGDRPDAPQPTQKHFETLLHAALSGFDATKTVFVESESQRIGTLQVPPALLEAMRSAPCLQVETPLALRVALLIEDYAHWCTDTDALRTRLLPLAPLHGRKKIEHWQTLAEAGDFPVLVADLLEHHYDPAYRRSIARNYPRAGEMPSVAVDGIDPAALLAVARMLIATTAPASSNAATWK